PRAPLYSDHSEPEISIKDAEAGLEAAEVSVDASDLPDAATSGQLPVMDTLPTDSVPAREPEPDENVVEMEAEPPPEPEEPPPGVVGEEPDEIVMTYGEEEPDPGDSAKPDDPDKSARVTEPVNDNSSPILTLTVDD